MIFIMASGFISFGKEKIQFYFYQLLILKYAIQIRQKRQAKK